MALEKFHYKLPYIAVDEDGEEVIRKHPVVLCKFDQIPFGLVRRHRNLPQAEQFFVLLEELLPEKDFEFIDQATQADMLKLVEAWQKDAGVNLGES